MKRRRWIRRVPDISLILQYKKGGIRMIQPKNMIKQMIDFNKAAYENAFKNMNVLQEQMEKMINLYIDQAVIMPEQSKKAAKEWVSTYKKGLDDFKKLTDDNYRRLATFFEEKTQELK
jgi:hypothetical protein